MHKFILQQLPNDDDDDDDDDDVVTTTSLPPLPTYEHIAATAPQKHVNIEIHIISFDQSFPEQEQVHSVQSSIEEDLHFQGSSQVSNDHDGSLLEDDFASDNEPIEIIHEEDLDQPVVVVELPPTTKYDFEFLKGHQQFDNIQDLVSAYQRSLQEVSSCTTVVTTTVQFHITKETTKESMLTQHQWKEFCIAFTNLPATKFRFTHRFQNYQAQQSFWDEMPNGLDTYWSVLLGHTASTIQSLSITPIYDCPHTIATLSNLKQLLALDISNTCIPSVSSEIWIALSDALSELPKLRTIWLRDLSFYNCSPSPLLGALQLITTAHEINISSWSGVSTNRGETVDEVTGEVSMWATSSCSPMWLMPKEQDEMDFYPIINRTMSPVRSKQAHLVTRKDYADVILRVHKHSVAHIYHVLQSLDPALLFMNSMGNEETVDTTA